jgi:hypothetical protein
MSARTTKCCQLPPNTTKSLNEALARSLQLAIVSWRLDACNKTATNTCTHHDTSTTVVNHLQPERQDVRPYFDRVQHGDKQIRVAKLSMQKQGKGVDSRPEVACPQKLLRQGRTTSYNAVAACKDKQEHEKGCRRLKIA